MESQSTRGFGQSDVSHTPGPWHTAGTFDPDQDPRQNIWSEAKPGAVSGELVARHAKPANARLIAAAPDLLALAKQYASECAECGGTGVRHGTIGGDGYGDRCAAIADVEYDCTDCADIREVLAKAEGRS